MDGPLTRKKRASKQSLEFAVGMIKEKIDAENKFVPDAVYECTGAQLKEYLAYAYREGRKPLPPSGVPKA